MYYQPTNQIDFDSIDWVALAGFKTEPIVLDLLTKEERLRHASILLRTIRGNSKLPKNYVRDTLEGEIEAKHITDFDKAWIVLLVNRLKQD